MFISIQTFVRVFYLVLLCFTCFSKGWSQKVFFSGNDDNSIYVSEDGRIFMSGENNMGQLGTGSLIPSNVPVEISGIDNIGSVPRCKQVQIEGVSTFLALTNSGDTVLSWGPNQSGQAGDGTIGVKTSPVIVKGVDGVGYLQNVKQIATGNETGYALMEDGRVLSWGANTFGQTGAGHYISPVYYPSYVLKAPGDTLKNVKSITAGGVFCAALLCDGTVWVWGKNSFGQLGQGNNTNSEYAIQVMNWDSKGMLSGIEKIEAGDTYVFALSSTDTLWAWGANHNGNLGTGDFSMKQIPDYVRDPSGIGKLSGVIDMAAGQGHGLALLSDKSVYAWGENADGQLGNNDSINSNLPVRVKDSSGLGFLNGVNHVSAGDRFSIVRTEDNQIFVWGQNTLGQLGLNDHVPRRLPVLLNLPGEVTRDSFPGNGKMEYSPAACLDANAGIVRLTKFHSSILKWEQSTDGFSSFTTIDSRDNYTSYLNLNKSTSYRAVLEECGNTFYSPVATVAIDSTTQPGTINSSATVRINLNKDTLKLANFKGSVVQWEYSHDNFTFDTVTIDTASSVWVYSNLSQTTWYRALVKRGSCPATYSDTAEIRTVDQSAVKIYNGFTPDGDDINDTWIIDFIDLFPNNRVEIYNRWGQLVFRTSSYDNTKNVWRGENNIAGKQPLADDTYFYLVDLGEGVPPLKGFVVISRGGW